MAAGIFLADLYLFLRWEVGVKYCRYFLQLLEKCLEEGKSKGEHSFILDGFPRTRDQAHKLARFADVRLAINLQLREEVKDLFILRIPSSLLCLAVNPWA